MDKELTPIKCPNCGSIEFEEWNGQARCSYCGTVFKERIKPLLVIPSDLDDIRITDGVVFFDSASPVRNISMTNFSFKHEA